MRRMITDFRRGRWARARQYLAHPVQGPRLHECAQALIAVPDSPIAEILGFPDDLKFRSSMTLFKEISEPGSVFGMALDRFCGGEPDGQTLQLLETL